jgi:hypothetical protein
MELPLTGLLQFWTSRQRSALPPRQKGLGVSGRPNEISSAKAVARIFPPQRAEAERVGEGSPRNPLEIILTHLLQSLMIDGSRVAALPDPRSQFRVTALLQFNLRPYSPVWKDSAIYTALYLAKLSP